jgi:mono/diheme cytochrome c family protein
MKRLAWLLAVFPLAGMAAEPAPPNWAHDIAPILYHNCVECHRPGQVAPFSLLNYETAAKRARFIARAVKARYMPPWLPDGPAGAFLDERRLTDAEINLITRWADAGAPAGDLKLAPTPPPAKAEGWVLGTPDLVVRMRQPFNIPPGPGDTYQVFPVPFSLDDVPADVLANARIPESNVWGVAAIEIHAGNPRSFHHADIWIDLSGTAREREAAAGGNGFTSFGTPGFPPAISLGGRVPGMTPRFLPDGIAASVLPAKGDLVFQIHYRATGKPETDQSEVGIYFMRQPVKRIMDSLLVRSFNLDIPAGDPAFVVEDTLEIPADCILMNVLPHMHLIAREIHASVENPDGTRRPLIDISRWDFKWQDRYVYREPIFLPKGARVHCRWVYDNSAANKRNPFSPPRPVQFGPNATDEMCALYLGLIPMNLDDVPLFAAAREKQLREKVAELTPEQRARHNWSEVFDAVGSVDH